MDLALGMLIGYFSGAIPASYLVARLMKGIDLREYGSGNVGATNVFRVAGPLPGIIAFILDFLKGYLPVLLAAGRFGHDRHVSLALVAFAAVAGHVWTVFLRFRGGKGVATAAGVFFALLPFPTLVTFGVFLAILLSTRFVSLGSIAAALVLPAVSFIRREPVVFSLIAALTGIVVIYRHKTNIANLLRGKENRMGKGAASGKPPPPA